MSDNEIIDRVISKMKNSQGGDVWNDMSVLIEEVAGCENPEKDAIEIRISNLLKHYDLIAFHQNSNLARLTEYAYKVLSDGGWKKLQDAEGRKKFRDENRIKKEKENLELDVQNKKHSYKTRWIHIIIPIITAIIGAIISNLFCKC